MSTLKIAVLYDRVWEDEAAEGSAPADGPPSRARWTRRKWRTKSSRP